jgi:ribosomal protein L20
MLMITIGIARMPKKMRKALKLGDSYWNQKNGCKKVAIFQIDKMLYDSIRNRGARQSMFF